MIVAAGHHRGPTRRGLNRRTPGCSHVSLVDLGGPRKRHSPPAYDKEYRPETMRRDRTPGPYPGLHVCRNAS